MTRTVRTPVPLIQTWRSMRLILIPITGILVARGFMRGCMASFLPTFIAMNTGNMWLAGAGLTILRWPASPASW